MRTQFLKITKGKSTKSERKFAEACKRMHVPFRTKVKINNHEVDFLIRNYAIEINGHSQDAQRNSMLVGLGYTPIHLTNDAVSSPNLELIIKSLCQ